MTRSLLWLSLALLVFRVVSALLVVVQPGFTDAYYYVDVARRVAHGQGLTADFVWNFLEAPGFAPLPVPSHRFWMPLASVLQAAGIVTLEPLLGPFRSAQAAVVAAAALVPAATYVAARSIGATTRASLTAAALAGIGGGAFAPAWVTLDSFAIAALVGTCFFIAFARAASGDVRAGAIAGGLVGILFLARAEGALFGVALLALSVRPVSRRAGIVGALVALVIGSAWLARGLSLGESPDLLSRTVLLARYEDFFAVFPSSTLDLGTAVGQRLSALGTDLLIALVSLLFFLAAPLAMGIRAGWRLPAVRAFAALALGLYVVEAMVWPLHATRGSYFHSLAAFYPFAMALVALGGDAWLARRGERTALVAVSGTILAASVLAAVGLVGWDSAYNSGYRARLAALEAIPPGPFFAIDAAAWRWIADRTVYVTPADGPELGTCLASRYGATSIVLEPAHFSTYESLYQGATNPLLGSPVDRSGIRVYPVARGVECAISIRDR